MLAPAAPTANESLRDACGIAASLSDFLDLLAPAAPTANESLRDAYGIRDFESSKVKVS